MKTEINVSLETLGFITFIVLLILKCCKVLTCSWFWVFFPLWLPLAISLIFIIIGSIVIAVRS